MSDAPAGAFVGALFFLICLSAFFSASETAMMAVNRYRLRHLAGTGHRGAQLTASLLERPDRLLGVILFGNNLVNFTASAMAGILALKLYGEPAIALAAIPLTLVVLVFAEVAPKTVAALYPERIAYRAAYVLHPLLRIGYPVVVALNAAANGFLKILGIPLRQRSDELNSDELRAVLSETGSMIPRSHQIMLLRILDLENASVEDAMVPRARIEGIDLDDPWDEILTQLGTSHHTRLPLYRGTLNNIIGIIHLRRVLHLATAEDFDVQALTRIARKPHYVPEGTSLLKALQLMQNESQQLSIAVDEYGDVQGLVTIAEILEEIVGEFTRAAPGWADEIVPQSDGSFLISGATHVRDLNRKLQWHLPTNGPKTLNGLILEYLEDIPEPGTSLLLAGYPVEVLQTSATAVNRVRIQPPAEPEARKAAG